jgi:hypothetical protein
MIHDAFSTRRVAQLTSGDQRLPFFPQVASPRRAPIFRIGEATSAKLSGVALHKKVEPHATVGYEENRPV